MTCLTSRQHMPAREAARSEKGDPFGSPFPGRRMRNLWRRADGAFRSSGRGLCALLSGDDRHHQLAVDAHGAVLLGAERVFEDAGLHAAILAVDHQHQLVAGGDRLG